MQQVTIFTLNQYTFYAQVSNRIFQVFASTLNMLTANSNQATLLDTRCNFNIALPPSRPLFKSVLY